MHKLTAGIVAVLACCATAQLATAQLKPGQREPPAFGLVGGLNLANMHGSDVTGNKMRATFHVGGAVTVPLGSSLFFQPNVLYSMKGPKLDVGSGVSGSLELSYLEVPVLLGIRFPMKGSSTRPYIAAGPYVGFKTGCKVKASSGGTSASMNCDDPSFGMTVKSTDFGVALGGGVQFGRLAVYGRYMLGLSEPIENSNAKHDVISIGVGYFFGGRR